MRILIRSIFLVFLIANATVAFTGQGPGGSPKNAVDDEEFLYQLETEHFNISGLNIFHGTLTPADVYLKLGNANFIRMGEDYHSPFYICYTSTRNNAAIYFKGITGSKNYIYQVKIVRNHFGDSEFSTIAEKCTRTEKQITRLKTLSGLSLSTEKQRLGDIFGDRGKYDDAINAYHLTHSGILKLKGAVPREIRGEYFVDAEIFNVSISIQYGSTGSTPDDIVFRASTEGTTLKVPQE